MGTWIKITHIDNVPKMGARKVMIGDTEIGIFKTNDNSVFAIDNICPHKQGKLSEGLVHEHLVSCSLHNTNISLDSGEAQGEDYPCSKVFKTKVEDGFIYLEI